MTLLPRVATGKLVVLYLDFFCVGTGKKSRKTPIYILCSHIPSFCELLISVRSTDITRYMSKLTKKFSMALNKSVEGC